MRYQHQATHVQVADIMTKDLGKTLHKKFRDVLMGRKPLEIVSLKLPESHKTYVRLHNEEVQRKQKELDLAKQFKQQQSNDSALGSAVKALAAALR